MSVITRTEQRERRHRRVRRKISGTAERPRMSIMISNRYMYVQFIDDERGVTLASATTLGMDGAKNNVATAGRLGASAAVAAIEKGVKSIVVDRGGFKYHGRVKAIVEAAVKGGLYAGRRDAGEGEEESK